MLPSPRNFLRWTLVLSPVQCMQSSKVSISCIFTRNWRYQIIQVILFPEIQEVDKEWCQANEKDGSLVNGSITQLGFQFIQRTVISSLAPGVLHWGFQFFLHSEWCRRTVEGCSPPKTQEKNYTGIISCWLKLSECSLCFNCICWCSKLQRGLGCTCCHFWMICKQSSQLSNHYFHCLLAIALTGWSDLISFWPSFGNEMPPKNIIVQHSKPVRETQLFTLVTHLMWPCSQWKYLSWRNYSTVHVHEHTVRFSICSFCGEWMEKTHHFFLKTQ